MDLLRSAAPTGRRAYPSGAALRPRPIATRPFGARPMAALAVAILVAACARPSASPTTSPTTAPAVAPTTAVAPASATPLATASPVASPERNPAAYVEGPPYAVTIDPADFRAPGANPYWPLVPGTTTILEGDGERIVIEVTDLTRTILGVPVTVVRDRAYEDGRLIEDTFDWYATDRWGNVWYFGEETTEYEKGKPVSTAGSWEAGLDGALPGIVMLAEPRVGDVYRNEYYAGEAEDLAKVLELGGAIEVPAGRYSDTLLTEDWTPLEPDQLERKTYAPGVGLVAEGPIDDPTAIRLVEIRQP